MIALDTCEWDRPGSHRSMITIEQAAQQQVREVDRAELIRQFNAKQWADRVKIKRSSIESETLGVYSYAATIRNMNFGQGDICRDMTRKTWKPDDWQGALVFVVNGRFYGYAAVCGNLFELDGSLPPAAIERPPETFEQPPVVPRETPPSVPTGPPEYLTPPDSPLAPPSGDLPPARWPSVPPVLIYPGPVPWLPLSPIPEPSTWTLILISISFTFTRLTIYASILRIKVRIAGANRRRTKKMKTSYCTIA